MNAETASARAGEASGAVLDVMRYCLHDGPGIRTTVFLKGCPLRCAWCHNPESQRSEAELSLRPSRCVSCAACIAACTFGAISRDADRLVTDRARCMRCGECAAGCFAEARELVGAERSVGDVLAEVLRDRAFYERSGGGVTFSGGEPLLHPDFLLALLRASRAAGLHTAVETCGFAPWETLAQIAAETDLFLYDVKLMDDAAHRAFTGVGNTRILDNLSRLSRAGHAVVVRLPLLPGINDAPGNLLATAAFLRERTDVRDVHLLPFHRMGREKSVRLGFEPTMPDLVTPTPAALAAAAAIFEQNGLRVRIGG
jgi:pyruvate formate lyase activating enzyme